eukprot:TRINITY_DN4852_c0_g1_i1.p1 TRINITY_DN4852_c0_g1~~TRINITY_DN4852_c0_g1_i1.p1  ORF type:complete len:497 (+),score=131.93 TRINITY_DN4852_c0_g1_i1:147-1637(+)
MCIRDRYQRRVHGKQYILFQLKKNNKKRKEMSINIKEKLQQLKDKEGQSLYNHLSNVMSQLLLNNVKDPLDLFEDYSHHTKLYKYDYKKSNDFVDNVQRLREAPEQQKEYLEKNKKLLDKITEGEEQQEVGPIGYVPNFMEESRWFEWAGVGFSQEEVYRIFKSLTLMSQKKAAKQVRLWGKILGSAKDYYVAEGIVEGGAEEEGLPADVEPKGQKGINKFNYFVTTDLTQEWVELPTINPDQLRTSRKIKYMFTGDLNREVITNPHFNGQEKHLLKCQIVRITATTSIVPTSLYQVNADDPREIEPPEEEKKFPDLATLSKLENWMHFTENILNEGRLVHMKPETIEEGKEEEEVMKQIQAKDPFEPRLKPISTDKRPNSEMPAWTIKQFGDTSNYNAYQKEDLKEPKLTNYGVIVIKNSYWPGQTTVYCNKQWQSLYTGYGFKFSEELYYPSYPEIIQEEQSNLVEFNDPNFPKEVPKVDNPEGEGQEKKQDNE